MEDNKQKITTVKPSVDLLTATYNHLAFLEECDQLPALRDEGILRQALYRYQHLFLPLAATHKDKVLEAPLDVAWVWHCHMLCPTSYCADCERLLDGVVVDHTFLRNEKAKKKSLQETKEFWQREYPNDPFEVTLDPTQVNPSYKDGETTFSYDIIAAAFRQKEFGYQVSLPHYKDMKFLEAAHLRYRKFLLLKLLRPSMFIVPCYDMDLMWHTHQLFPRAYKQDTENLYGKIFNHDDSVNDRSEGSKLNTSDAATRQAWREEYNQNFAQFGAMYRGPNPAGKLAKIHSEEILAIRTRHANISCEKLELVTSPHVNNNLRLKVYTSANEKVMECIGTLKGPSIVWQGKSLFSTLFKTRFVNCLKFSLEDCRGWACLKSKVTVAQAVCDLLLLLEEHPLSAQPTTHELTAKGKDADLEISLRLTVSSVKEGPVLLSLKAGSYTRAVMPENLESMWGPIPLPRLPPGTDNWCEVASHSVLNHRGEIQFTCRLIHSLALLQSAVHVFFRDRMVCVGHLIGSDTLPVPAQLSNKYSSMYLNPRAGDRAMVIKNHDGDWMVLIGRWTGYKKGVAGVPGTYYQRGTQGVPGNPGHLSLRMWKRGSDKIENVSLQYEKDDFCVNLKNSVINLKTGSVKVYAGFSDVAETLALAFSISLLQVLCQPRPAGWKPGQSTQRNVLTRGARAVNPVPSEEMAFVMAAGFLMSTPSNHFVRERYGNTACAGCGGGEGAPIADFGDMDTGSVGGVEDGGGANGDAGGGGDGDGGAGCGGCGGCGGGGGGGGGCGGGGGGCGGGGCGGGGCGGCGGCGG